MTHETAVKATKLRRGGFPRSRNIDQSRTPNNVRFVLAACCFAGTWFDGLPSAAASERIVSPAPEFGTAVPNFFGMAVATSGNWLLIGAPKEDVPGVVDAGAAYLYELSNGAYVQRFRLIAADAGSGDGFGSAVAIDGDVAVVGSPDDNIPAGSGAGSAYVFARNGAVWEQRAKLVHPSGATADEFGASVAIARDTIVVGAFNDNIDGIGVNVGSTHVFRRSGTQWTHGQTVLASDAAINARFGRTVAISGNRFIATAQGADANAGAAYAYSFDSSSVSFEARLVASDRVANDRFGSALSLDDSTALIGAYGVSGPAGTGSGAAYVFSRLQGQWLQQAKLVAPNAQAGDQFGVALGLHRGFAAVGAPLARVGSVCCEQGSVDLFVDSSAGWRHLRKLSAADVAPYDYTGSSIAVSAAGIVGGAPGSNDPASGADATGSVVRFEKTLSLFANGFDAPP